MSGALPEELKIGVKDIDSQHEKIFTMLNLLEDKLGQYSSKNWDSSIIEQTIKGLEEYIGCHFSTEMKLLTEHNYPDLDKHKAEHDFFIGKVIAYKRKLQKADINLPYELLRFIKGWAIVHISETDSQYGIYLRKRGVV